MGRVVSGPCLPSATGYVQTPNIPKLEPLKKHTHTHTSAALPDNIEVRCGAADSLMRHGQEPFSQTKAFHYCKPPPCSTKPASSEHEALHFLSNTFLCKHLPKLKPAGGSPIIKPLISSQ